MLTHGAKNLILLSRSAAAGGRTAAFVTELQEMHPGCKIRAIGCDISSKSDLAAALKDCAQELPPIRGVLQAAMVLEDSILENMTLDNYNAALRPKVHGSYNLHELLGSDLDFFIMLSSLAGIIGLASQTNYTAGGAFQDALARHRVAKGLPCVSIDLGAVKDVGYVSANKAVYDRLSRMGYRLLSEREVLSTIESTITSPCPQVLLGINTGPSLKGSTESESILAQDSRFTALRYCRPANAASGGSKTGGNSDSLASKLSSADSVEDATAFIAQALVKKLVDIFMVPEDEIVLSNSMASFGVDSLVAVELRNMLALQAGSQVSIFDIMQSASLESLSATVASSSAFVTAC